MDEKIYKLMNTMLSIATDLQWELFLERHAETDEVLTVLVTKPGRDTIAVEDIELFHFNPPKMH